MPAFPSFHWHAMTWLLDLTVNSEIPSRAEWAMQAFYQRVLMPAILVSLATGVGFGWWMRGKPGKEDR